VTRRLFVGVALDDASRTACAAAIEALRRSGFAARFEDVAKLHATLAFLGNVDAERFDDIVVAMNQTAASVPAFEIALDKTGAFPNERRPRVVFVGAREHSATFRELCALLRGAYGQRGFAFKDDAVAHVTIARVKDPCRPLPSIEVVPTPLTVDALTLFESIFDKENNTSRYVVSATARLRAP
jgi:2'-5' RNA ligase